MLSFTCCFSLKDKEPITIERNLTTCKIDLLLYPRAKVMVKLKPSTQVDPTLQTFARKFHKVTNELIQGQLAMMNRLTIIDNERGSHPNYSAKPQF